MTAPEGALPELWNDDHALVDAVLAHEESAARAFHGRYDRLVGAIAWRFARNRSAAEDLSQEIWLHLLLVALPAWRRVRGSLGGFVAMAARRKAIDWWRRRTQAGPVESIEELQEDGRQLSDAGLDPVRMAAIDAVRNCLERVGNQHHRQALELFLNGWRYEEIAGILRAETVSAVGTWVHRGKEDMKPCLENTLAGLHLDNLS